MINGWNYLALIHGSITALFGYILVFGEPNMFTLPMVIVFAMATNYCGLQWIANRTIKKLETKHGR